MNSEITFYRSASRLEEERLKAVQELEEVKKKFQKCISWDQKCIPIYIFSFIETNKFF